MGTPTLTTERLILSPVTMSDAPSIQKYFNNWNIIRNLTTIVPWPYPNDGAEHYLKNTLPKVAKGSSLLWGIHIKKGPNELVGIIEFNFDNDNSEGNRGFWLAEPFWGKGYMSEAVIAVQDYLFFELCIDRIVVVNVKSNIGSRRVKEKTGAKFIGNCEIEHRSGETESEKWEITSASWESFRCRNQ